MQIATNEKIQTTSNDLKRLAQLTKRGEKNFLIVELSKNIIPFKNNLLLISNNNYFL